MEGTCPFSLSHQKFQRFFDEPLRAEECDPLLPNSQPSQSPLAEEDGDVVKGAHPTTSSTSTPSSSTSTMSTHSSSTSSTSFAVKGDVSPLDITLSSPSKNEKHLKVHNPHHFILYFSSQWLLATLRQFLAHARSILVTTTAK